MAEYENIKYQLHTLKPELLKRYGVTRIGFFDTWIDKHHNHESELNILVELRKPLGWEFFAMKEYIERKLMMRVDICTANAIKPALKEEILNAVHYA